MFTQDIEIRWIFNMLRRGWWLIVLVTLLATGAAYFLTTRMPPVYQASATLLISPAKNGNTSQYTDLMASGQLAITYSQMLKDRPVLAAVAAKMGLKQSVDELAGKIQAERIRDTQLIQLTVSDSDPVQAAEIANTLAQVFKERVDALSAERYDQTINNAQDRVQSLQTQVDGLEAQTEALRSQKVAKDVLLANKQVALDGLRKDYQTLQNSQQQTDQSIAIATGKIYVFEPVQVKKDPYLGASIASAVISVGQAQTIGVTSLTTTNAAQTYGDLIIKTPLLEKIIRDLALTETPTQLAAKIAIDSVDNTQLIQLMVKDTNSSKAERICNALVDEFVTKLKELVSAPFADQMSSIQPQLIETSRSMDALQGEIGQLTSETAQLDVEIGRKETVLAENRTDLRNWENNLEDLRITAVESADTVVISEPAQAPRAPSQKRTSNILVGGLIGLVLGTALAFLLAFIDDRIRTDQDVRKKFDLPILGNIGRFNRNASELVMYSDPSSTPADDFRVLGMNIQRLLEEQKVHVLLVTSPTPMDGKSVIVSNLSLALARMGQKVIAVDADFRLPRLNKIFGLDQAEGLITSLSSGYLDGCLQNTQQAGLKVLTSGGTPPNPAELLASSNFKKMANEMTQIANIILVDCPPVLAAADALILATAVDGVLLVLNAGRSENQSAQSAVEALQRAKANILGVVLNAVPERNEEYYRYYRKTMVKEK